MKDLTGGVPDGWVYGESLLIVAFLGFHLCLFFDHRFKICWCPTTVRDFGVLQELLNERIGDLASIQPRRFRERQL